MIRVCAWVSSRLGYTGGAEEISEVVGKGEYDGTVAAPMMRGLGWISVKGLPSSSSSLVCNLFFVCPEPKQE